MPREGGDEDIFREVLYGLYVSDLGVSPPRMELVDGECTGRSCHAKVGAGDLCQEMNVEDSGGCGQRLDDITASMSVCSLHWQYRSFSTLVAAPKKSSKITNHLHMITLNAHQYQAAVALLVLFTDTAIVRGASCSFCLVWLLEVVRADYGILRIQREELDTAWRQIELERVE
jgi:hypothetical protein